MKGTTGEDIVYGPVLTFRCWPLYSSKKKHACWYNSILPCHAICVWNYVKISYQYSCVMSYVTLPCSTVQGLYRIVICSRILHSMVIRFFTNGWLSELTKNTIYLTHTGELWPVYCVYWVSLTGNVMIKLRLLLAVHPALQVHLTLIYVSSLYMHRNEWQPFDNFYRKWLFKITHLINELP